MKLIAGTRGSALAIAQTDGVIEAIKIAFRSIGKDVDIEKRIISTKGDRVIDKPLDKIGDKGLFVAEIESLILSGEIDFAVHSLKDMPSEICDGLMITKTLKRADFRDVLIINSKHKFDDDKQRMDWLKSSKNLKIGTGSKRRAAQILEINKSVSVENIRGNIDTRIRKLEEQDFDGIIIAKAGIDRLGIEIDNMIVFDENKFIPACGQGALAVEIKSDNSELRNILESISDEHSHLCVEAERSFLESINGGCHSPVGAIAHIDGDRMVIRGIYGDEDMNTIEYGEVKGSVDNPRKLGSDLADILREKVDEKFSSIEASSM